MYFVLQKMPCNYLIVILVIFLGSTFLFEYVRNLKITKLNVVMPHGDTCACLSSYLGSQTKKSIEITQGQLGRLCGFAAVQNKNYCNKTLIVSIFSKINSVIQHKFMQMLAFNIANMLKLKIIDYGFLHTYIKYQVL